MKMTKHIETVDAAKSEVFVVSLKRGRILQHTAYLHALERQLFLSRALWSKCVLGLAALTVLSSGCTHKLTVRNLDDYRFSGMPKLQKPMTIGVVENGSEKYGSVVVNFIATEMRRSGAQVQVEYPYVSAVTNHVDVIANISVKPKFKGSGANFLINFPGFLVWAPAWNGYVYKANFDIHVDLTKGSSPGTVYNSFDLPINLDIRHAAIDRTWTEVSWLEFGVIAFIGGIVFIGYDSDVTPVLMREIEQPIGEYAAKKILMEIGNPKELTLNTGMETNVRPKR